LRGLIEVCTSLVTSSARQSSQTIAKLLSSGLSEGALLK
jgi:hypothetical protein